MNKDFKITTKQAQNLAESGWWMAQPDEVIAKYILSHGILCCPFSVLHKATETLLKRPVYTHEFADTQGLLKEANGLRRPENPIESLCRIAPHLADNIIIVKGG